MQGSEAREYRQLAARANYLALDRADIQFAVKEICRGMAAPTVGDKKKLKRLVRYLISNPRVGSLYEWQGRMGRVKGYSDSDWSGCRRTARSTSGGAIMIGGHCLKTWSSTQETVALSSGEAELIALVKVSSEIIGMMQMAKDWGCDILGEVYVDSSAALGVVARKGNGKLRHVRVGHLWVQEKRESEELKYQKVEGTKNPGDLMTKNVAAGLLANHMQALGFEVRPGRASCSLNI